MFHLSVWIDMINSQSALFSKHNLDLYYGGGEWGREETHWDSCLSLSVYNHCFNF